MTLLLTTHDLPDVERLCRRVVVIGSDPLDRASGGRVLVDDSLDALRRRLEFGGSAAGLIAEVARRVEIRDVSVDEPSIEDLVRTLYAGGVNGFERS